MRLFIALVPDDRTREALAAYSRALRRACGDPRGFTRPELVHLTLRFLGEQPSERVPAIARAIRAAARDSGRQGPALRFREAGFFPGRPDLLWLDLHPDPALAALADRVDGELAEIGVERDPRPFRPHMTLARRLALPARRLSEALASVPVPDALWRPDRIVLMESALSDGRREYTVLAEAPLGANA